MGEARRPTVFTLVLAFCAIASACTTVTTPVLRHETGEALGGAGSFKGYVHLERARLVPAIAESSPNAGVAQKDEVFVGTLFGVQGAAGIHPRMDAQAGAYLSQGGGGWRLGLKYQWKGSSNAVGWAMAAMGGYSRASGRGTITYQTTTFEAPLQQTLAAKTIDVSLPVSYRFSPTIAAYSGLSYFHNIVSGVSGSDYVSAVTNDFAWNLGVKVSVNFLRFDVEAALLQVHDPFTSENRIIPVYGLSAGVQF